MEQRSVKYVIITPARNEESFIEKTILSVVQQTFLPTEWVIVNDGSTDATGAIIDRYAKKHTWMHAVHRKDRGFRKAAWGVMESFYEGLEQLKNKDFEYIVKLDADTIFEKDYFERCFEFFYKEHRLGICGGGVYSLVNGELWLERNPEFHVRGATKIYRRACWIEIGCLLKGPGWDTVDEVKANMLGWSTRSVNHLKVVQQRSTGAADGTWRNAVKDGVADYGSGYHPLFAFAKYVRRALRKPFFILAFAQSWGYIQGYLKRFPRENDRKYLKYIRRQQLRKLLLQDSIWK